MYIIIKIIDGILYTLDENHLFLDLKYVKKNYNNTVSASLVSYLQLKSNRASDFPKCIDVPFYINKNIYLHLDDIKYLYSCLPISLAIYKVDKV